MALYKMEIFGLREGHVGPVLRERHDVHAPDDQAAIAQATRRYDELAAKLVLTNFSLYDNAGRLVCETVRKDHR